MEERNLLSVAYKNVIVADVRRGVCFPRSRERGKWQQRSIDQGLQKKVEAELERNQ